MMELFYMSIFSRIFNRGPKKEPVVPNYPLLWNGCKVDDDKKADVLNTVKKYWIPNKDKYLRVSKLTGVPSWVVFAIHWKEASCRFDGALHNGDRCIGNGKKTWNVPSGRGPFNTWEETAIDALLMKKNIFPYWESIPRALEFCEKYNGLGHRNKGELSPYIWAYTNNHDETGNYVSDGKYSSTAVIRSAGVASLLLAMIELGEVELGATKEYIKIV